ncbi:MAG TPA: VWA domain-containing protein [Longimicrobiales bacterium]
MSAANWALFALAAAGALAVVFYLYGRKETPGRGRLFLAGLRWAVLSILVLLLFDPMLPLPGRVTSGSRTQVLVDGSLSMSLPVAADDTTTRWERAVAEAGRLAGSRPVVVFGDGTAQRSAAALDSLRPDATSSRLLPALRAAAEGGARKVVVVTDGGIEDAAAVARTLPGLGLDVETRIVGGAGVASRALAEVDAPGWAKAGEPLRVRVGVTTVGGAGDSVAVVLREGGRVRARARLATAAPGRVATAVLEFTPEAPPGGGLVRYDVALEPADAAPADDARSIYVYVGEDPAGVVVVSFHPDWEPRFLQPVLTEALGLPVRGFLRAADGRYLQLGAGADAGAPAEATEVRRAVERADLVVLHALGSDAPDWARRAAARKHRVLIFPAEGGDVAGLPIDLAGAAPGEWYASGDLPASPLTPMLGSLDVEQLPPLVGVRAAGVPEGAWAALEAHRGRRGAGVPVVLAGEGEGRRWAVATAAGFWRWAFRGGDARQAYRRLWAALGGWLLHEEPSLSGAEIRPVQRVAARGAPMHWVAPGVVADSVALSITDTAGAVVLDTALALGSRDSLTTPALPPGHYRYRARAIRGGDEVATAEGPVSVESYSPEFTRAAAALTGFDAAGDDASLPGGRSGAPLHTTPWPYLLLVLLVSTEWVLRRRWGLR